MAILLFLLNVLLTLSVEKNEFNLESALLILLMLFSYSKMWVSVVVYALILSVQDKIYHKEAIWDKTERFEETDKKKNCRGTWSTSFVGSAGQKNSETFKRNETESRNGTGNFK